MKDQVISQVLWRWPDTVGRLVDPNVKGEPTAIYHALYGDTAYEAASSE